MELLSGEGKSCGSREDQKSDETLSKSLRSHSLGWYRKAIDNGDLTGLKRTLAEKRIQEYADRRDVTTADKTPREPSTIEVSPELARPKDPPVTVSAVGPDAPKPPMSIEEICAEYLAMIKQPLARATKELTDVVNAAKRIDPDLMNYQWNGLSADGTRRLADDRLTIYRRGKAFLTLELARRRNRLQIRDTGQATEILRKAGIE